MSRNTDDDVARIFRSSQWSDKTIPSGGARLSQPIRPAFSLQPPRCGRSAIDCLDHTLYVVLWARCR